MKSEFEPQDIQLIAEEVAKLLRPLLVNNSKQEEDIIFDVKGLAGYLHVNTKWVYDQTSLKAIPFYKLGNQLRFKKQVIDKWLETLRTPAVNPPGKIIKVIKRL